MTFREGNPESWKPNEFLERKKAIVEMLSQALQLDEYLEKTADTAGHLQIAADCTNALGEPVTISVSWLGMHAHEDNYQFYIQGIPTEEEATRQFLDRYRIDESHPHYRNTKEFVEKVLRDKRPIGLYAIDKVVYDTSEGNTDANAHGGMAALFGKKNGQDVPADAQGYLESTFEVDDKNETLTKYNDNKDQTIVSSERALEILAGLTVKDIQVMVNGKPIE